jgi:hypothetical protein
MSATKVRSERSGLEGSSTREHESLVAEALLKVGEHAGCMQRRLTQSVRECSPLTTKLARLSEDYFR